MKVFENISKLRKQLGYSQDDIANKLGISRQTYLKFENGQSDLQTKQLQLIADFFGVNVLEFYYETQNTNKFKEMMVYILKKFKDKGVPKTKLAKLLYLCDFHHFYYNLESISSAAYKCKEYGPLAEPFLELIENMFNKGEIRIDPLSDGAQMISISPSMSTYKFTLLSKNEQKEINEICEKWKNVRTQEIVNFTHRQKPWMSCRDNEIIPYELILQEDPNNVY